MIPILRQILRTGIVSEPAPAVDDALRATTQRLSEAVLKQLGRALVIRHVDAGSCNGCELEIHALNNPYYVPTRPRRNPSWWSRWVTVAAPGAFLGRAMPPVAA